MDFLMTVVTYVLPFLIVLSIVVSCTNMAFHCRRWCGIKVDAFRSALARALRLRRQQRDTLADRRDPARRLR